MINNYKKFGSSAICLDIRNSTLLMRSFRRLKHIKFHADFMWEIKELIFENGSDVAVNDTGDGFIALFWDERHAWRALTIAVGIKELLIKSTSKYNRFIKEELLQQDIKFGFGIALHSGGSIVCHVPEINRNFIYGVVVNTTARLESFTKIFTKCNFLLTGHFKEALKSQTLKQNEYKQQSIIFKEWEKNNIRVVTSDRVDIKDGKKIGHILYTITDTNEILDIK